MSTSPTPQPPVRPQPTPQPIPTRIILEQGGTWSRWSGRLAWIGLVICLLVIAGMYGNYQSYMNPNPEINEKYHSLSKLGTDKVAIVTVDGTILHTEGFVKWQIDRIREDDDVKAAVVRVDSPGGTVTGSHYIYHHLKRLVEDKEAKSGEEFPLVVSMGGIAASGGYYVSMAVGETPNSIFAEPTTWTGSIGVIIPHYDVSGLMNRFDIKDDSVASHRLKDILSPTKEMTEEERKILQELVDESFNDFLAIVKSGRPNLSEAKLTEVATGQVFTAKQAHGHGLVDQLGFIEDAIDRTIELAQLDRENVRVIKYTRPKGLFDEMLFGGIAKSGEINLNLATLLDMTAPRAYYLCSWLPSLAAAHK